MDLSNIEIKENEVVESLEEVGIEVVSEDNGGILHIIDEDNNDFLVSEDFNLIQKYLKKYGIEIKDGDFEQREGFMYVQNNQNGKGFYVSKEFNIFEDYLLKERGDTK